MKTILNQYTPGLGESWLLVFITAIGGGILSAILAIGLTYLFPTMGTLFTVGLYPVMYVVPAIYIWLVMKGRDLSAPVRPIHFPYYGRLGVYLTFALAVILIPTFNYICEPLYSWLKTPQFMKEFFTNIGESGVVGFITVAIFAPVFEELLCRGVILRGLLRHTSPAKAIIWSSLMFGVMHLNPWQAIPAVLAGILFGWVYYKTGSLYISIFLHSVNNSISFVILKIFPNIPYDSTFKDITPPNLYLPIYVISLCIVVITLIFMNKYYDKPISHQI